MFCIKYKFLHTTVRKCINKKKIDLVTDPRLYQEIKERGLQSNIQGPEDEEFVQVPEEDQGIVVKNYKAAYVTWSQLPQVRSLVNIAFKVHLKKLDFFVPRLLWLVIRV